MIISRGRRYIFVHAPKTGGTSLALALEARAMADDILIGDTPKALKRRKRLKGVKSAGRLWKHSKLADIDGLVSANELDGLFIFSLVRNPWDRLVSYYHWLQGQSFAHPAVQLAKTLSFEAFLRHPLQRASFSSEQYGSYVTDALGVERQATFVRLEHLQDDLVPVEAHLGFSLGEIPRANASPRESNHRAYYTEETRKLVAEYCGPDIRRFGYAF